MLSVVPCLLPCESALLQLSYVLRGGKEAKLGTDGHRDSAGKKWRGSPLRGSSTTQAVPVPGGECVCKSDAQKGGVRTLAFGDNTGRCGRAGCRLRLTGR